MLRYKFDVMSSLKEKGYSTYKIRQESLLSSSTVQSLKSSAPISWSNIDQICYLLDCQPGDLLEHIPDRNKEDNNE